MRKTGARMASTHGLIFGTAVGKLVRDRRRELGISQTTLGEMSNGILTQNWLSKVETGEYLRIPEEKIQVLADALDLPVSRIREAQEQTIHLADAELGKQWAVGMNPMADLMAIAPRLDRPDQRTLVRIARAMAYGKNLRDHFGDDMQPIADGYGDGYGARFGKAER